VRAVVSRGGRPDLAEEALDLVAAPTLLIVGGRDDVVIELNRNAFARITAPKQLEIVPGATHLFEEPARSIASRSWRATGSCIICADPQAGDNQNSR
jgi:pimeloyl-ACP methyl ester carboxylesterase